MKGHGLQIRASYCELGEAKSAPASASSAKPNDNFSLFWQNALSITLPKKAEVRTISGLPPHVSFEIAVLQSSSLTLDSLIAQHHFKNHIYSNKKAVSIML